jgi:hypothetical protein
MFTTVVLYNYLRTCQKSGSRKSDLYSPKVMGQVQYGCGENRQAILLPRTVILYYPPITNGSAGGGTWHKANEFQLLARRVATQKMSVRCKISTGKYCQNSPEGFQKKSEILACFAMAFRRCPAMPGARDGRTIRNGTA